MEYGRLSLKSFGVDVVFAVEAPAGGWLDTRRSLTRYRLQTRPQAMIPPSHEPAGYCCPFCAIAAGAESEFTAWRDDHAVVQISLHWNPVHPGKALVIPLAHHENIYTLPTSWPAASLPWCAAWRSPCAPGIPQTA